MKHPDEEERPAPIANAVLIAGPTASGKSAFALDLAGREGGVIVNADSMQVYDELRVLTARPSEADLKLVPHRLYGHVPASHAYSTGAWLADVEALLRNGSFGERPIFVGGTGLYFKALLGGLSDMPAVSPDVRAHWRARLERDGAEALHRELGRLDTAGAATLRPGDGQRIVRALEVFAVSGRSILWWQGQRGVPLVDAESARRLVIEPSRASVVERIDRRFDAMLRVGLVEEVSRLIALDLDPALPAMKAIGVPEFSAALSGRISFGEATTRAKTASRQYAKRQSTWFRNQFGADWTRVKPN